MTEINGSYFVGVDGRNEAFNNVSPYPSVVDAGAGNDLILVAARGDAVYGGTGNDVIQAQSDDPSLGGLGETLYGDVSGDPFGVAGGDDQILGGSGPDSIFGGGGADFVNALFSDDSVFGGAGDDIVWGGNQSDRLYGDEGNDTLFGNGDSFYPDLGTITVDYDGSTDTAYAPGDPYYQFPFGIAFGQQNTIADDNAADQLYGGAGNDTLSGQGGGDLLDAGDGDDHVYGGSGGDIMYGGDGDDLIAPGTGSDAAFGGAGLDALDYSSETQSVALTLDGDNAVAVRIGGVAQASAAGFESVYGGSGNDRLTGDGNTNYLAGNEGRNTLSGAGGDDVLVGGTGKDTLNGGGGADIMVSDSGKDKFVYGPAGDSTGAAYDTIESFDAGHDVFVFPLPVSGVDAAIAHGALSIASFDTDLAAAVKKNALAAGHAVLFTPDDGNLAGDTFLIVDSNGKAGYQAGKDYVIQMSSMEHANHFGLHDFTTAAFHDQAADTGAAAVPHPAVPDFAHNALFAGHSWSGLASLS